MAAGLPSDKPALDLRAGNLVLKLRDTFTDIERLDAWLSARVDADLVTLGYTAADAALLRTSFGALARLARIADGRDIPNTATAADNYFFKARHLTGVQ